MAIEKTPGEPVRAILRFNHKGWAERIWVGFGIGPGHQDPITMTADRWIGGWVDIPEHLAVTLVPIEVTGVFPRLPFNVRYDVNKVVAPSAPPFTAATYAARYSDDWDDEVYVTPAPVWDIKTPTSEYF